MTKAIKQLTVNSIVFRPIEKQLAVAAGVKRTALTEDFALKSNPYMYFAVARCLIGMRQRVAIC